MRMPRHDADATVSEPEIVPDLFITSALVERNSHVIRFVGFVRTPQMCTVREEHRVVVRLTMPIDVARGMRKEVEKALREGEEREG